jgi:hypothetical protein
MRYNKANSHERCGNVPMMICTVIIFSQLSKAKSDRMKDSFYLSAIALFTFGYDSQKSLDIAY